MKALLFVLGVLATTHVYAESSDSAKKEFIEYLLSDEEPSVKDAFWMSNTSLYAGMVDDGSSRNGFAEYVCLMAGERQLDVELVKIVDIKKARSEKKFVEIGKALCAG